MIIVIILGVAIIVYIKMNKQSSNNNSNDNFVDKFKKAFGLKTISDVTERFEGDIVFNTIDDIIKNMNEYLKYVAPDVDMNEINSLLRENGLDKTAETILNEHKNINSSIFTQNFQVINTIIYLNIYNSFKSNNEEEINQKLRINLIIIIHYSNIVNKIKQPSLEIILADDFMTNDVMHIYFRTSNNKNIPFSSAIELNGVDDTCLTENKLCKTTKNISKYIIDNKTNIISYLNDIDKMIKLFILKFLFDLNNIDNNGNPISSPIILPIKITDDISISTQRFFSNNIQLF
jgi:hypothetical protein